MAILANTESPLLGDTLAEEVTLLEHCEDETLFLKYLQTIPEPTQVMEHGRINARLKVVRGRIRDLSHLRETLPRRSAVVDNDLAKEKFRLKALKWQLFRINELPAEVLVEIFRYVVLSTHVTVDDTTQKLRLTWVCRRFRGVALEDAILWGSITFNDPAPWERSLTFFARAKETPIEIWLDDTEEGVPRLNRHQVLVLAGRLKAKAHVLRSLAITLDDWACAWFFLNAFADVSAPQLEYMQLHRGDKHPHLWSAARFPDPESAGPIPLFNSEAPNVSCLFLKGISVDWDSVKTAKLVELNIHQLAVDVCPTMEQFRALLAAPNLMSLDMEEAGPIPLPPDEPYEEPVFMPKLRRLRIDCMRCETAVDILSCINAPDVRMLAFERMYAMDNTDLFEMLPGTFEKVEMLTLVEVQLDESDMIAHATTWIDMMTGLRVLQVGGMWTSTYLSIFVTDPEPHRSPRHFFKRNTPPPASMLGDVHTVAPSLHTLCVVGEAQERDLAVVLTLRETGYLKEEWEELVKERDAQDGDGPKPHPLSVVTISAEAWHERWGPHIREMTAFLGDRLQIHENPVEHITREEARIRASFDPRFKEDYDFLLEFEY